MSIADDIKRTFRTGSSMVKLIYINLAVFILVNLVKVFLFFLNAQGASTGLVEWLAVPAWLPNLASRPWTVITYMFTHENFLHILFNLLTFYWFSTIFLGYFDEKKLLNIYILGGLFGALFYILAFNLFPVFGQWLPASYALGASASIMAVIFAISLYVPDYSVYLVFIGRVKLKYLALFFIGLDILSIPAGNAGGHIAHLGGAFLGSMFTWQYRKGRDITKWFGNLMDWLFTLFKRRERIKVTYRRAADDMEYNKAKMERQAEIDLILEKISKGGYESLSKEEKDTLFKAGK